MVKKITCIGAGYVGGPTMVKIAEKCTEIQVTVVDISEEKIENWNSDDLPVFEPGLKDLVMQVRGKNLFFSSDVKSNIEDSDMIFIAVGTTTKMYGEGEGEATDLSYWMSVAKMIAESNVSENVIIVEKSTVPVGTAEKLQEVFLNYDKHFNIVSNPEFLAEGTAMQDLENPDRILIGGDYDYDSYGINELVEIYAHWVPRERIITSNLWSAEMSKLAANAFLAQRISSINSLTSLCEKTGADILEISKSIGLDSRIGKKFLKSGPGFGGSCFKKDILNLVYLLRSNGLNEEAEYWRQVIKMNELQVSRVVGKLYERMQRTFANRKIAVFGYAFKADTNDSRETPSKKIIDMLLNERANVVVCDPMSNPCYDFGEKIVYCKSAYDAAANAEAIILVTDWSQFIDLDWKKIYESMEKSPIVIDCRNCLDAQSLADIGFTMLPIGRQEIYSRIPF